MDELQVKFNAALKDPEKFRKMILDSEVTDQGVKLNGKVVIYRPISRSLYDTEYVTGGKSVSRIDFFSRVEGKNKSETNMYFPKKISFPDFHQISGFHIRAFGAESDIKILKEYSTVFNFQSSRLYQNLKNCGWMNCKNVPLSVPLAEIPINLPSGIIYKFDIDGGMYSLSHGAEFDVSIEMMCPLIFAYDLKIQVHIDGIFYGGI